MVCLSLGAWAQKTVIVNAGEIAPLSFSEKGKPAGIAVEILDAVAKDGKYRFEYHFLPWPRAQNETQESQQSVGIVPLTRTAEREPKYTWVTELFQQNLVFVTTGATPAPKTKADALKLTIGLLRGNQAEKELPAAGAKVDVVTNEAQNAQKLRDKRIDAWLVSEFVAPLLWKEAGGDLKDLHVGMRYGDAARIFLGASPGFTKQDAEAIDAAVAKLRQDGTVDKILAKYRQ